MSNQKIGVYFIGGLGSIATTVVAGAAALAKGLIPPTGMVTCSTPFAGAGLAGMEDLVFGGCDIRAPEGSRDLFDTLAAVHPAIVLQIRDDLDAYRAGVIAGCARNCGEAIEKLGGAPPSPGRSAIEEIESIRSNIALFRSGNDLNEVVVVNLASTEPPLELSPCHSDLSAFEQCLRHDEKDKVRASTLYSCAAILEGCAYINFTPSNAALPPAVVDLAVKHGVPVMGNDGKTGETLVKSALAPMFAARNLEVLSWEGFNLLGNMDGRVLDHPGNRESKIKTKDRVLAKILGYSPHTTVGIGYVPSLDDQKTAWDFIHFRGFLGAKMSLQFVWQGYDSMLAAPLVLDLIRLAQCAKRRGDSGLMPHLASFFKAPLGVDNHAFADQFRMLLDYAETLRSRTE